MRSQYRNQAAFVDLIRQHGPLTVFDLTEIIHGETSRLSCKLISTRLLNARKQKLIEFAGYGERRGNKGILPAKWKTIWHGKQIRNWMLMPGATGTKTIRW